MPHNLSLYAIHGIDNPWDDEPFDLSRLPFDLGHGVSIENVSGLLGADAFSEYVTQEMGILQQISGSRHSFYWFI
jgi:hypothetical protein